MRLIVGVPVLVLIVLFALSNDMPVHLGLWPTGVTLDVPLSIAMLAGMAIAFVLGALFVWIDELRQRRRARRAEYTVRLLEEQVQALKAQQPRPVAVAPPLS